MTKEAFFDKINAGETIQIGRYSCCYWDGDFFFHAEETEVYKDLDKLWDRVKFFVVRIAQNEGDVSES